ncbi:MAG: DNA-processing protein DprA [Gemmataceae bacterium]|nr:DNA-processing protein DprA [Gemmataceae bacterium]
MELSGTERDLLALRLVPGIGPKLTAALLERFGSVAAIAEADLTHLTSIPYLGEHLAAALQASLRSRNVDAELEACRRHGVRLLFDHHPDYPALLRSTAGRPQLLYVKGTLPKDDVLTVAVVGSRTCTSYGLRVAERLGRELAQAGVTVVSGLARGIDAAAHRGALSAKGRTVAVLANGLAKIYPPEHTDLAEQIIGSGGALVSEANMHLEPMAGMFPARNRIISGLCRGVVVVEAAEKSGALITARHAADQGRDVFAIPGPVDSAASAGTLQLLRHGARLVRHARDILDDLAGISPTNRSADLLTGAEAVPTPNPTQPPPNLDPVPLTIWDALHEPRHIDELCRLVKVPIAELSGLLTIMELNRWIRRLPGNVYERR